MYALYVYKALLKSVLTKDSKQFVDLNFGATGFLPSPFFSSRVERTDDHDVALYHVMLRLKEYTNPLSYLR